MAIEQFHGDYEQVIVYYTEDYLDQLLYEKQVVGNMGANLNVINRLWRIFTRGICPMCAYK